MTDSEFDLKSLIRDVPDFPKPGIVFKDLTPLLADAQGFRIAIDRLAAPFVDAGIQKVVGIESRGFFLAGPIALALGAGLVIVRKAGKLPWKTQGVTYDLEYGSDTVEMHTDSVADGERVLIVDDLIATGGTCAATVRLAQDAGGGVVACAFLVELDFLEGRAKLGVERVHSLLHY
ncbi:MAG: adenine phosphoribosyltransferase [Deltaproteobacteria bacterium]|nr:adenine phosphoribosyltransferase [Deltaproteobacteria bacterium]MBW2448621.1 adenine phosphoribosyltransferase [Deltaproteobacteria bacterium]